MVEQEEEKIDPFASSLPASNEKSRRISLVDNELIETSNDDSQLTSS